MNKTKIPWADYTWTVSRGCSPISEGCKNCYAARLATRFSGPGGLYDGLIYKGRWNGVVRPCPENLDQPARKTKPAKIFVNSMSDLFHESMPHDFLIKVFDEIRKAQHHTFQVLTKRPNRMAKFLQCWGPGIRNLWVGVTAENQNQADERVIYLNQTPGHRRFLSIEPLLGYISLFEYFHSWPGIDWVIVGAESGPGARPCELDWIRSIRDQCLEAEIPLFIKQARINGELVKMPEIDGVVYNQFPK